MDKIKKKFLALPMRKSIRWTFLITFFCVCILMGVTFFQTHQIQNRILEKKEYTVDVIDGTYRHEPFTSREAAIFYGCYVAMAGLPVACLLLGMGFSSRVFYRLKLQEPLRELQNGISKIAMDDLDFSISYDCEDELGSLCRSMERMRRELCSSNEKTWKLLQQRRLLNASVAHDLRTPITVLKGYIEYLKEDAGEKRLSDHEICTVICGMEEAVARLEQYVGCVQDIDRLESLKVQKQKEDVLLMVEELKRDICPLGADKEIGVEISCSLSQSEIDIDKQLLFRLIENLTQNAVRYATREVMVELREKEHFLIICVKDDGKGFQTENMDRAADLFFTTEDSEHFGIGLNICKIICEKLKGAFTIENRGTGGACVTATIKLR